MSCFGLSQSSSSSFTENNTFLQKPLTKAALLVIGLFFAGGAVAIHIAGLGTLEIVTLSVASGLSIAMFIIACLRSQSSREATIIQQPGNTSLSSPVTNQAKLEPTTFPQEINSLLLGYLDLDSLKKCSECEGWVTIADIKRLWNVKKEYQMHNKVRVYDCTQKDISVEIMNVTRQTDGRKLDIIGLMEICNGTNGLGEPATWTRTLPVQFSSVDSDPNEETNKYFVVKDHPSGGVEILEHRLSTEQGAEEIRYWHVNNSTCGHYPCYYFAARRIMPSSSVFA